MASRKEGLDRLAAFERTRRSILVVAAVTAFSAAKAQGSRNVALGPLRRALLDAARIPCEEKLKQPIVFVVQTLCIDGDWAFLHANMQKADGSSVDYRGTEFEAAAAAGHKSKAYAALMRRQGGWRALAYVIGPTDVTWATWPEDLRGSEGSLRFSMSLAPRHPQRSTCGMSSARRHQAEITKRRAAMDEGGLCGGTKTGS